PHRRDRRRDRSADRAPRRERRAPVRAAASRDQGSPAAAGFSDSGLRPHPAEELPDADLAVLQRLSLSLPGLRYSQPLRPAAPAEATAELDAMRKRKGHPPVVYFVDDNFIGNRKAAKDMLPHLLAWQKQHGYPLQFACEATLNIAK